MSARTYRTVRLLTIVVGLLLVAGLLVIDSASRSTALPARDSAVEATREVPAWMTRECPAEDSVNCWYDGGDVGYTGTLYIRKMPGTGPRPLVCVIFADNPRRDYCERRR